MEKLSELIKKFCEIHSNKCIFRGDYSGRCMFGKQCVGIVYAGNPLELLVRLCDFLYENDIKSGKDALGNICQDSMGRDIILYFPQISTEKY